MLKNKMLEYKKSEYKSINKKVCSNCVGERYLKQFVIDNGKCDKCDYCGSDEICISVEDLISEIISGIEYEYDRAVDTMSWDHGEYVGAKTWDTYNLIYDKLGCELPLEDDLIKDIYETIDDDTWCERDPYQLRESIDKALLWDDFCEMVKTKTRYVFFRMPKKDEYREEANFNVLDYIGKKVTELNLITSIPENTTFFRGRMHSSSMVLDEAKNLCSPPSHCAKSNRMSAEGISIFYGANDVKTAIAEIYNSQYKYATVAPFVNLRNLILVDLTKVEDIEFPSLFDKEKRKYRQALDFFIKLNENLTQPIENMVSIEYIPAQIIAEYFRYIYCYNGISIDGIAYRSSKNSGGICYSLFFNYEQCLEVDRDKRCKEEQELKIDKSGINTYAVSVDVSFSQSYNRLFI
ncbi:MULTISPECIES: HEPN-associated N-terminal domain-containing protein [unclassified Sedimentibacter]|uniref:HEPN-associated N-terminal domain-containing protein n=1 Tax=unclassified Sedimentibacter TaxID=2649220 RepID=UPI0027DEAF16|nr:HEPN-associated N-terminal domain-containing protein [Sedimentibacter sp. MB35-C1]WMJ77324.1 HEPN-associated N-terminal domain-containing protein [Sedimentibacter sp. MB35-C1]